VVVQPAVGTVAAERRDWWVTAGWSGVLLVWLAGTVAWLENYYVFSRQETSPVDGPVPDVLALLAVAAGVCLVAVMVGRARALAPAPSPVSRLLPLEREPLPIRTGSMSSSAHSLD